MKTRILITILILALISLTNILQAKNPGKFTKYSQVTDKEVMMESTKGVKVLFSAFDNNSIGITYYNGNEKVQLISPAVIFDHVELNGSIYVEELDDMMQITTTSNDGLVIKIDKKKFGFTFIDKASKQEILVEENLLSQVISNEKTLIVGIDSIGLQASKQNPSL